MLIPHHQKFIWEHTHQFWRMAFLGSETKFLIRKKRERIIDGSGVFRAPGNHPHSIKISILLQKGNFYVTLPGEHLSYCLIWDGWDLTKGASQSFNCILTLCRTCSGCLKELLWHEGVFLKTGTGPCSSPLPSSLSKVSKNQEQAYSLMLRRLSEKFTHMKGRK